MARDLEPGPNGEGECLGYPYSLELPDCAQTGEQTNEDRTVNIVGVDRAG